MKLLGLIAAVTLVPVLFAGDVPTVSWPDAYTTTGRIILPYADVLEPFNVSVNMKNKQAVYSFYNGMDIIYYRGDMGKYGTMYKIVPVTMNSTYNKMTCFKVPGYEEAPVTAVSVLPDISMYNYSGQQAVEGVMYDLFVSNFTEGNKSNIYTLFVQPKDKSPYMLYFLGYDRLLGSHYDEYVVYYDTFTSKAPSSKVFDPPNEDKCGDFPGPGNTSPATYNVFHEVIGTEGKPNTQHVDRHFEDFKQKYGRKYLNDKEHAFRRKNFHHNLRFIESKNRQGLSYKVAVNHLADLTKSEIKRMRGYRNTGFNSKFIYKPSLKDLPSETNWRLRGAVTPVKDQGICGSCWSFGTTGTLEGSLFLKTGRLVSLSEQAFVDCSWGQGNNGCDGGESERAFEWMLKNGCLPTEMGYGQYLMQDGMCHANKADCGAKIKEYFNTPTGKIDDLRAAIAENGPISVAIDASHLSFSFYSHGVYFEKQCGNTPDDLDHQVLAVGYGVQDGKTYWLIKNSWSTHWGMDGYVLMSDTDNNCGVATDASFAVIA